MRPRRSGQGGTPGRGDRGCRGAPGCHDIPAIGDGIASPARRHARHHASARPEAAVGDLDGEHGR